MTRRNFTAAPLSSSQPRGRAFARLLAALVAFPVAAQTHKVEAPERVTRAVAVYEWTGDLSKPDAARLVPVSLFINGHLEDAGVYLARPVPFALQPGDVYSVEVAGEPRGTVDLNNARDIVTKRSATDDNPVGAWYGYGSFVPPAPPKKGPVLKASKNPSTIVGSSDSDRPTLHRAKDSSADAPAKTPGTSSQTSPDTPASTTSDADADRPHMSRRSDTASPSTSSAPADVPDNDPDRPTLRKRDPKEDAARRKADSGSTVTSMATSLNDDPNRPSMRRGKPAGLTTAPELTTLPPNLHQVAAVSDAATRPTHVFAREWGTPTERTETLSQLDTIARSRVSAYLIAYHLAPQPVGPAPAAAAAPQRPHSSLAKRPPPLAPSITLSNEQLTPYTLSYDGLPTFVFTAEMPLIAGGPVYATLVAQRLPSGEMQIALSSVTDAGHLDRGPWLRLVDAVDPTAGHRASLLFELRAQSTRQFALYDLVSAQAEQRFVTNPIP